MCSLRASCVSLILTLLANTFIMYVGRTSVVWAFSADSMCLALLVRSLVQQRASAASPMSLFLDHYHNGNRPSWTVHHYCTCQLTHLVAGSGQY